MSETGDDETDGGTEGEEEEKAPVVRTPSWSYLNSTHVLLLPSGI